jgi:hypothetical protein
MRPPAAGLVGSLVVLAAASSGVVLARHELGSSPAKPSSTAAASAQPSVVTGRVVQVESGVPSTTFLPLGSESLDRHTLSAQRAYNLLVSDSAKLQLIPATVQSYYGALTDASASPTALHTRVWAFATTSGCIVVGGVAAPGDPTPSPVPRQHCRIWEFVDATSGHDLGVITQQVLPD